MRTLGIILAVLAVLTCAGIKMSSTPTLNVNREVKQLQMVQTEKSIRSKFENKAQELAGIKKQLDEQKKTQEPAGVKKEELEKTLAELQGKIDRLSSTISQEKAKRGHGSAEPAQAMGVDDSALKEREAVLREEIKGMQKELATLKPRTVSAAAADAGFNPVPPVQ